MKVAIHSRPFDVTKLSFVKTIFDQLDRAGASIRLSRPLYQFLTAELGMIVNHEFIFDSYRDLAGTDLMVSVGGDGTLLEAVTLVRDTGIPILGINLGRLGFLANVSKEKIAYGIEAVMRGQYEIDERTMLQLNSTHDLFGEFNFALNEITISKRDSASMIVVHTYLDNEYLNSYWADGLIIATPTGSTAYSISVGGPVVLPHSQNFILSPISPHNLNVRPLIISDAGELRFEVEGRNANYLVSLDSRSHIADASVKLSARKCDFPTRLVRIEGENFLSTLRQKLNWGVDSRN